MLQSAGHLHAGDDDSDMSALQNVFSSNAQILLKKTPVSDVRSLGN